MKLVRADFCQRTIPPRWTWWVVGLLAIAAVAMGRAAGHEWEHAAAERDRLQGLLAQKANGSALALPVRPPPPYDASARDMLVEHALPWSQALTAIEAVAIIGVTPVAVEAAASERAIRLEVTFTEYSKLLEYVETLNGGEPELQWMLAQSQSQPGGGAIALIVGRTRK